MIFRRLIEAHSRSIALRASMQGYAISMIAHLGILGGALWGTRHVLPVLVPAEGFTPVEYLVPKEEIAGSRPRREQVSWVSVDTRLGEGFLSKAEPSDPKRIVLPVAKGSAEQLEVGTAPPISEPPIQLGDSIMTELEVDSAVRRYEDSAAPPYPPDLLRRHVEGFAVVQYVVDTLGHVDTTSFRIISATHVEFARTVKVTLPLMRFSPARMGDRHVPQLVEQPFVFKIMDTVRVRRGGERQPR